MGGGNILARAAPSRTRSAGGSTKEKRLRPRRAEARGAPGRARSQGRGDGSVSRRRLRSSGSYSSWCRRRAGRSLEDRLLHQILEREADLVLRAKLFALELFDAPVVLGHGHGLFSLSVGSYGVGRTRSSARRRGAPEVVAKRERLRVRRERATQRGVRSPAPWRGPRRARSARATLARGRRDARSVARRTRSRAAVVVPSSGGLEAIALPVFRIFRVPSPMRARRPSKRLAPTSGHTILRASSASKERGSIFLGARDAPRAHSRARRTRLRPLRVAARRASR